MSQNAPKNVRFLVSDDLREETNGKMTVIGLYADDKIWVLPSPIGMAPPQGFVAALPQLCIGCIFLDGSGRYDVKALITSPSGTKMVDQIFDQTFISGQTSTIGIRGNNLLFPEFGKYKCEFTVGNANVFRHDFELLQGPPPPAIKHPTSGSTVVAKKTSRTTAKKKRGRSSG
jgi:hypothetical protein